VVFFVHKAVANQYSDSTNNISSKIYKGTNKYKEGYQAGRKPTNTSTSNINRKQSRYLGNCTQRGHKKVLPSCELRELYTQWAPASENKLNRPCLIYNQNYLVCLYIYLSHIVRPITNPLPYSRWSFSLRNTRIRKILMIYIIFERRCLNIQMTPTIDFWQVF